MKLTKPNQHLKLHVVFSSPFQKVVQIETPITPKKKNLLLHQCWCGGGHVNIIHLLSLILTSTLHIYPMLTNNFMQETNLFHLK